MPVILSYSFPIRVNGDGTVSLLAALQRDIRECGCSSIADVSSRLHASLEQARGAAKQLAGDGAIACDEDAQRCCVDGERLARFVGMMKGLRGGV